MKLRHIIFTRKEQPLLFAVVITLAIVVVCAYLIIHNSPQVQLPGEPEPVQPLAPVAVLSLAIAQVVPSGLRFVRVPSYSYNNSWYYRSGEMGLIDFYIYPHNRWSNQDAFDRSTMPGSITFKYQARAVLPGTYIMEADAISFSGDNNLYAGERLQVTVTK